MKQKRLHLRSFTASLGLITLIWLGAPARVQAAAQQDNDTTRAELAKFDQFLDSHPEIAEQLRQDPSRANNYEFMKNHPALQTYLQDHPAIREEIKEDPNNFMSREKRFDSREDKPGYGKDNDTTRAEMAKFDKFLDSHRKIADDIRQDPSRVNNYAYLQSHPELRDYLQDHPALSEEVKEDPYNFMSQEKRFDSREDKPGYGKDNDTTRAELAQFDKFLDSHRNIADDIRQDPSRVNNYAYLQSHAELRDYLQDHPALREEIKEDPYNFMSQEKRFDRSEDKPGYGKDNDTTRAELAKFDQFLDSHPEIAEQIRQDPSRVNNYAFMKSHPALQSYLQDHPAIREEIKEDPYNFMSMEKRYDQRDGPRDRETPEMRMANFHEFLAGHERISQQLSRDPERAKSREFQENNPEFREYLQAHPGVQQELNDHPQSFVKSAQQFNPTNNGGAFTNGGMKSPSFDPKRGQ